MLDQSNADTKKPDEVTRVKPPNRGSAKRNTKPSKVKPQKRIRKVRPYPASSFEEALTLAQEIVKHAPDGKIRRLTFSKLTNRSATSSSTQMLITNSGKYGITKGSYIAEHLEVTSDGLISVSLENSRERMGARFTLAVDRIVAFKILYDEYKGKKIPSHEVLKDFMKGSGTKIEDLTECLDLFIVNVKFLGLLQTIAGSETLIPLEHVLEELNPSSARPVQIVAQVRASDHLNNSASEVSNGADWAKICFYISPIGEENSEERNHSDLFLNHLVEPALEEFGLKVVRADQIGETGMITSQILEHILRARLAIVDLSFRNPNVFYELAVRHACKLPIVQIMRKSDRIPFDVDQVRTIQIDNSGIYSLVPKLATYRSEIATHVRQALANPDVANPLTLFCPGFQVSLPK